MYCDVIWLQQRKSELLPLYFLGGMETTRENGGNEPYQSRSVFPFRKARKVRINEFRVV